MPTEIENDWRISRAENAYSTVIVEEWAVEFYEDCSSLHWKELCPVQMTHTADSQDQQRSHSRSRTSRRAHYLATTVMQSCSHHVDLELRKFVQVSCKIFGFRIFHFWYSDVTVEEKGNHIIPFFKPQQSHGDDGWWSGWRRRPGSCIDSIGQPVFQRGRFHILGSAPPMTPQAGHPDLCRRLTRRCRHHRRRSCGSPCTPRYQQPCA